jgi:hypothetical protein
MRRVRLGLVLAVLLGLGAGASPAAQSQLLRAHGLRVVAPPGWRHANQLLSDCIDPTQALAITNRTRTSEAAGTVSGKTALVLVLEDHGVNPPSGFPTRKHFHVPARAGLLGGCCDTPNGPGYEFLFRDQGRDFYAYVYASKRSAAQEAVAILNTLRVSTR